MPGRIERPGPSVAGEDHDLFHESIDVCRYEWAAWVIHVYDWIVSLIPQPTKTSCLPSRKQVAADLLHSIDVDALRYVGASVLRYAARDRVIRCGVKGELRMTEARNDEVAYAPHPPTPL